MSRIIHYRQLLQLVKAQFKETIREPGVLFWGIIFPILMSLGLGVAFTRKPEVTRRVAVVEDVRDTSGNNRLSTFIKKVGKKSDSTTNNSETYQITIPDEKLGNTIFIFEQFDWEEAMVMLKRGNLNVVLDEQDGQIRYHFDPVNPDAQLTYLKLSRLFGGNETVSTESEYNIQPLTVSGTRYIDFLIPGLISMGVMMSCMWGLSYGIIEKRSQKLLRRMVATPMKKTHFLVALITVRLGMNIVEALLLFLFAWIVFNVTIQGSVLALLAIFIAGNITFAGIAIFVSSHTSNTEIGNGFINVVVMPMMVLSGIFFSYHNFPDWSLPVIRNLPLTLLTDGVRSIFIEGAGLAQISLPFLILVTIGVVFFGAGLRVFKWY